MSKIEGCTYPDCFKCKLSDCVYDVSPDSLEKRKEYQKKYRNGGKYEIARRRYLSSEKGKKTISDYKHSAKGRDIVRKYSQTDAFKESQERYRNSEKGKATISAYKKSDAYKESKKKSYAKYYETHKEKIQAYQRAYYLKKKQQLLEGLSG